MVKENSIYGKLKTATWVAGIILLILGAHVKWGMPHGPMINTEYEVCDEDYRGGVHGCHDKYVEDTRKAHIPDWAKYLRDNTSDLFLLFFILIIFFEYKLIGRNEDSWPNIRDIK